MNALEPKSRRATRLLAVLFIVAFLALIGRLVYLQLEQSETLAGLAEAQQRVRIPIPAYRGAVLDRHGRPMAATAESYSVFADPKLIYERESPHWRVGPEAASVVDGGARLASLGRGGASGGGFPGAACSPAAQKLAAVLDMNPVEIEQSIEENVDRHFVWLKRRVDRATRDAVLDLQVATRVGGHVRHERIFGVGVVPEGRRYYPGGQMAAHVLGAVGSENQGLDGLEYLLDDRLSGEQGYRVVSVDGKRRAVWMRPGDYQASQDGQLVVLTIDLTIQMFAEEALQEAVKAFAAKGGCAVVMDPASGEVLALANYPAFDPQEPAAADPYASRNRALTDPYEPGSTFKCFVASAALEERVVRSGETIFCHNGVHFIRGRRLSDVHGYGNLSFEMVVIKSSNIGMAIIGERMGNDRLYAALKRFGFGDATGILLPGESRGLVYPLDRWSAWSATSVPMGYEVLVTPLQLVTAFSAIANGGMLMKPRVVRYAYSADRRLAADFSEPVVVRRALKQGTADFMRRNVLRGVVERGTGTRGAVEGFRVFGKTGTAKKRDPNGPGYSNSLYVGSFIGAAPLENPRVVAMVVIDEPDKSLGYYGGTVAAPAVRQILEKTLAYLRVPPDAPSR